MLVSSVRRNLVRTRSQVGLRHASAEEIHKYKTDSNMLAKWLDVGIVSKKGRAFEADRYLIAPSKADVFPPAKVFNLDGQTITIPTAIDAKAKLVVVSFKHYGFSLLRSWIDPFIAKFNVPTLPPSGNSGEIEDVSTDVTNVVAGGLNKPDGAIAYEICFVEYGFLSMAKSMFLSNVKTTVDPSQVNRTGMIFGGVRDFAAPLLLPNVYTGYAFLLDRDNRIRWRGSGQATPEEAQILLECTQELLDEKV